MTPLDGNEKMTPFEKWAWVALLAVCSLVFLCAPGCAAMKADFMPPSGRDFQQGLANTRADIAADVAADVDMKLADFAKRQENQINSARDAITSNVQKTGISEWSLVIAFLGYYVVSKAHNSIAARIGRKKG